MAHRLSRRGQVLGLLAALLIGCAWFGVNAARLLVVNDPQPADVIVVLEGGTWARVTTGLQYLSQGYSQRLILDTDETAVVWGVPDSDLARQWIDRLPGPQSHEVSTCPTDAESTLGEAQQIQPCLEDARTVLIVSSQYHTRRALAIFRHVDPSRHYSVAGADEPDQFGLDWWRDRDWTKQTGSEWMKLAWFELFDRWYHVRHGEL